MNDVLQYSSEGETDSENDSPQRKVDRVAKVWVFQRKFDSASTAKQRNLSKEKKSGGSITAIRQTKEKKTTTAATLSK